MAKRGKVVCTNKRVPVPTEENLGPPEEVVKFRMIMELCLVN